MSYRVRPHRARPAVALPVRSAALPVPRGVLGAFDEAEARRIGVAAIVILALAGVFVIAASTRRRSKRKAKRAAPTRPTPTPREAALSGFDDAYFEYAKSPTDARKKAAQAAYRAARKHVSEKGLVDTAAHLTYEMDYVDASGSPLSVTKAQMWQLGRGKTLAGRR